jgi:hypothetical protein
MLELDCQEVLAVFDIESLVVKQAGKVGSSDTFKAR